MTPPSLIERLGEAFTFDPDGCWRWSRHIQHTGYTLIRDGGQPRLAHRVMYELLVGPIPDGLQIDHLCRVRHCVNPAHMEPVTAAVNTQRGPGSRDVCPRGHAYDAANTYVYNGKRQCRRCKVERQRERRAAA